MTSRISITVPDDVAEHLRALPEGRVSGYVSEAVRQAARREREQQALRELHERYGRPSGTQRARAEEFAEEVETFRQSHGGRPAA